eukprot:scaffold70281_cov67-Cyclotella_meneghiniana.AAC.10
MNVRRCEVRAPKMTENERPPPLSLRPPAVTPKTLNKINEKKMALGRFLELSYRLLGESSGKWQSNTQDAPVGTHGRKSKSSTERMVV